MLALDISVNAQLISGEFRFVLRGLSSLVEKLSVWVASLSAERVLRGARNGEASIRFMALPPFMQ